MPNLKGKKYIQACINFFVHAIWLSCNKELKNSLKLKNKYFSPGHPLIHPTYADSLMISVRHRHIFLKIYQQDKIFVTLVTHHQYFQLKQDWLHLSIKFSIDTQYLNKVLWRLSQQVPVVNATAMRKEWHKTQYHLYYKIITSNVLTIALKSTFELSI